MVKTYNQQNFSIKMANGEDITFFCHTTKTRNGFCHTCWCIGYGYNNTSKISYCNRTWESYDYQSVLLKAFNKLRKADKEICLAWEKEHDAEISKQCDAFVDKFKKVYEETPQSMKDAMAQSDIHIESQEDAEYMMGLMTIAKILEEE